MPTTLSETDLRCLQLAAEGIPVRRIAATLDMPPDEVQAHFVTICAHFEALTLTQAIVRAIRMNVIS